MKVRNAMKTINCPFCGGIGTEGVCEAEGIPELEPLYYVACNECGAVGPMRDTPMSARSWWNREMLAVSITERNKYGNE